MCDLIDLSSPLPSGIQAQWAGHEPSTFLDASPLMGGSAPAPEAAAAAEAAQYASPSPQAQILALKLQGAAAEPSRRDVSPEQDQQHGQQQQQQQQEEEEKEPHQEEQAPQQLPQQEAGADVAGGVDRVVVMQAAAQPQPLPPPPPQQQQQQQEQEQQQQNPSTSTTGTGHACAATELAEARAALARVEASRDSIARDLGHQRGCVAKLEGTVSSLDKRLKGQVQENQIIKARLAEAVREAAAASVAASITPDRCRSSVKAMQDETLRAQEVARQREAQVHKLQQLMAHEAEEMAQLQDFESQERGMLLASHAALQQALQQQGGQLAALQQQLGESRAREGHMEGELHNLRKEVWDTKNQNIELMAEGQHMHSALAAAQAAAATGEQQAASAWQAQASSAAELSAVSEAGVKLFKQIRAVTHSLERNLHHFQKVPEVALCIRQLVDWTAKQAANWTDLAASQAEAAAAAGAGSNGCSSGGSCGGAGAAVGGEGAQGGAAGRGRGGAAAGGDDTMTVSLGAVMALGNHGQ